MSDFIPPPNLDREQRRANRAERRRLETNRREAQEVPAVDIEPEPDPTLCAWCGFIAFFDTETPEVEMGQCPACGTGYDQDSHPDEDHDVEDIIVAKQRAVHRRQAFALDRIAGTLQEAWDEACERLGIG